MHELVLVMVIYFSFIGLDYFNVRIVLVVIVTIHSVFKFFIFFFIVFLYLAHAPIGNQLLFFFTLLNRLAWLNKVDLDLI